MVNTKRIYDMFMKFEWDEKKNESKIFTKDIKDGLG
jgi:hypothetical protein